MHLYPLIKKLIITLSLIPLFSLVTLYADPAIQPSAYGTPAQSAAINNPNAIQSSSINPNLNDQRYQQRGTQPRVYINNGLYQDYNQPYYNNSTVRGRTIVTPVYNIPPAREPLRSPGSSKGPLKIENMPARK